MKNIAQIAKKTMLNLIQLILTEVPFDGPLA